METENPKLGSDDSGILAVWEIFDSLNTFEDYVTITRIITGIRE